MARKTNKTAHVLNLISKAKDEHQSMDEQMKIDNTGSDIPNDLLFMGIEPSNDKSISEKINENLEALVEQDEPLSEEKPEMLQTNDSELVQTSEPDILQSNDKPQIEEKPVQQRMPEPSPAPRAEPSPAPSAEPSPAASAEPSPAASAEPSPAPSAEPSPAASAEPDPAPSAEPSPAASAEPSPAPRAEPSPAPRAEAEIATAVHEEKYAETKNEPVPSVQNKQDFVETPSESVFHYVNVYEQLVLERLEEFQTMFNVCTCPRCTADVIAVALTNLPAKYIVTNSSRIIPLLTFLREKYKTAVATQLSSACVKVKQNPSHS